MVLRAVVGLGVLLLLAARVLAQDCGFGDRYQIGDASPAMAYDPGRDRVVRLGSDGRTWEFGGARWHLKNVIGGTPAPVSCAMVYDAGRHAVLMFRGGGPGQPADTWTFDGLRWTRLPVSNPPARSWPSMVYDSTRGVAVLFGGANSQGAPLRDTWELGATGGWVQRAAVGPSARRGHAMAFDAARGRVVLFGGLTYHEQRLADVWEWDGLRWTERPSAPGPSARAWASMAYDPVGARTVLFGGENRIPGASAETWAWDGAGWTRLNIAGPEERQAAGMVFDSMRGRLVLFGGSWGASLGDTWAFSAAQWTRLLHSAPTAAGGERMTFDPARGAAVMFGGYWAGAIDETWEWNGDRWVRFHQPAPSARSAVAMTYDTLRQRVVLFGGDANTQDVFGDTWTRQGVTWVLRSTAGAPPARSQGAMSYDSDRDRVVLFGGGSWRYVDPSTYGYFGLGDTWEWDGLNWQNVATTGPSPRYGHMMVYDPVRRRTVLFGGVLEDPEAQETWEWDGTRWVRRMVPGPPGRSYGSLIFDTRRERVVLLGGLGSSWYTGEVWEWDGQGWLLKAGVQTGAQSILRGTYDTERERVVAFGGWNERRTVEWDGSGAPLIRVQPRAVSVCYGGAAEMRVGVADPGVYGFQWMKDGTPLPGATSSIYPIPQVGAGHGGDYWCRITNSCGETVSAAAELRLCYANCDCSSTSPALNVLDFSCFLNRYMAGDPYANCDGSTGTPVLTAADLVCFMERYVAGCP
jgi:hypothetical protein